MDWQFKADLCRRTVKLKLDSVLPLCLERSERLSVRLVPRVGSEALREVPLPITGNCLSETWVGVFV